MGQGRVVLGVVCVLVVVACGSGTAEPPALTDPTTTPTSTIATTVATETTPATSVATTTTATTAATTTTLLEEETVGSKEAFEAQVDAVYDFLDDEAAPRDTVPFPDSTNLDPLVAFEELILFHYWMVSTNPWQQWAKIYAFDGTAYASDRRIQGDRYSRIVGLLYFDEEAPFLFLESKVADLGSIGAPDHVLTGLPATAVAIEYTSTVGDFYAAVIADGRVFEEYDGWTDLVSQAIVVPTSAGWRIAYVRWND